MIKSFLNEGERQLARMCPNCGLHVSDKAKYCRKCGTPIGTTNVYEYSFAKNIMQYSEPFETSKNRLGLKGIKSILMDLRKGFRRTPYLIPVFVIAIVWIVVSLLISIGVDTVFLRMLSYFTYSDAGMNGGFLGLIGGIAGKMVYAYFIVLLMTPLYSLQKPFRGIIPGAKTFITQSFHFKNMKDIYMFVLSMGLSFIGYNMLTGDNTWTKSIISLMVSVILLRAVGRKSGVTWDTFNRVFSNTMSEDITIKAMGGYVTGILLAIFSFVFRSSFISYYIGLFLVISFLVMKFVEFIILHKSNFRRIFPVILVFIMLFSPLNSLAAPETSEVRGIWILQDIKLIDPDTNNNPNENTYVSDGYIRKHNSVDSNYTIEYFWNTLPEKIHAGDETKVLIEQKMVYTSDQATALKTHLNSAMFITYKPNSKEPEVNEYFQGSRDFSTEGMFINYEQEYTAFFLRILNYYELYDMLNKNNCKLTISIQASFGGRVEYIYRLQRTPVDGFFTWFVGDGSKYDHLKPLGTVLSNLVTVSASMLCATVSVGALTLKRRKNTAQQVAKKPLKKEEAAVKQYPDVRSESDFSENLVSLYDTFSNASQAGWPKYREVLIKTLSKSKDHTIQSKNGNAIESSINSYTNSISGIMKNLSALGYNNDTYGIQQRGEVITNTTGKIVYANYVFNSLASKTPYSAFIELANAFALENTKARVIASPSVHMRGIMSLVLDAINDSQSAYRNAINGRYGEKFRNMVKEGELSLQSIEAFSSAVIKSDELDSLYERVISGTITDKDNEYLSRYLVCSTKRAVKQAQTATFRYENTSLVVRSLFDWQEG
ncbi:MAG: zinc ribbon domain-containing protein [Clostridia bacterium]|nr:zinc ribbon domain-containing protein [Clostridia bacterium]